MPPRPSSPRISYLPALVAVSIFVFLQGTYAKRLTLTFSPFLAEVNAPSELMFRSRYGRSCAAAARRLGAEEIEPEGGRSAESSFALEEAVDEGFFGS